MTRNLCKTFRLLAVTTLLLLSVPAFSFSAETGYASWYGGKFHGRQTANGEIFNTNKLTAAHKTLPFGTVVEVKNLRNGSTVRVRINDRGPFVEGRIIDLSRAAAQKIDMLGSGVTPVSITVVQRPDGTRPEPQEAGLPGAEELPLPRLKQEGPQEGAPGGEVNPVTPSSYTLQIASFSVKDNARQLHRRLASHGFSPAYEQSGNGHIRVVLTGIPPRQLKPTTDRLAQLGYASVLVREHYR